ncbi:alpha-2-macroglobulin family protein [Gellertiella hungarica]|nr:alpha-2-macroglobulin family protein [Gellertiella hungarica]
MRALARLSALLLLSLLAFSSAHAAGESRKVVTVNNGDYYGFDLRSVQNVTLDGCKKACLDDQSCRAFTYNPKVKWCFLKSDYKTLNAFPGAIAGRIVEAKTAAGKPAAEPDLGAAPPLAFLSQSFVSDARYFRDNLTIEQGQEDTTVEDLIAQARAAATLDESFNLFKNALSLKKDDGALWLEAARIGARIEGNTDVAGQASFAAFNGYLLSRTASVRADSLAIMAAALDKAENYRPGLEAYKASLKLVESKSVRAAFADLRQRQGFRVTGNTVDNDSATPRACVQFSEQLVKSGVDYSSFVQLDGKVPEALEAKDNQICVEGLQHGSRYKLALRAGLPSVYDESLEAPVDLDVYVQDRSAMVRFTGDNFVLPGTARRGIPIVSVNTEKAELKLYRVGERNLAQLLANSQFLTQVDGYSADRLENEVGQLVWQGSIEIASELNKEVVTSFPVDEAVPQRKPGVYALTAKAANSRMEDWDARSTQWFVVSDIGISTYTGTDGLNVFARSLATAKPLANIELTLLAKNNEVLGTAKTDGEGRASFDPGLVRGTAGNTPAMITASNGADDYVFLDLTRAGFDLSDRGVTGRAAPGAIDVLAWTERGIYRPGETVHASALARDISASAVDSLPLTFVFTRPDGVEMRRIVTDGGKLGGHMVDLEVQDNAMRGTWTMQIYTDPKQSPIAEKTFLVDDFVPDRIEFDMTTEAKSLDAASPAAVAIDGRYLYGAPAAGLKIEGELTLKPTRETPAFPGYVFGLADEEDQADNRMTLDNLPLLDQNGHAVIEVSLGALPSTTRLLNGEVTVRLREGTGRAVERKLTLPVRPETDMIGIKPEFTGEVAENSAANFNVIMTTPEGDRKEAAGLKWTLLKVERDYQWYRDGNSWKYEPVLSTRKQEEGTLNATTDGAKISVPVVWGRYRLEVQSADGQAVSSVEFDAGWYVAATSTETPDGLEVALDKDSYKPGDTAHLKVSPRFAGEVLVNAGTESLLFSKSQTIGAEGGVIDIPVTADWGAGAYVTATLFRPGDAQESRMPMRAIGIKWLGIDPGDRALDVKLSPPEKMLPRQTLTIPVEVAGAGAGEEAYVAVAAVDVGILNLTAYEAPDPNGWYFGQRQLGLEIRDLYGRLIDGSLGITGKLRTGGDGGENALQGSPPKEKLVAFFSGPVKLDASGKAVVSFDIPQFNGTARVMAVAWTKTGVGHAETDVIIRDPVVVTASMPQFLAPGDESQIQLDIANADAPDGDYQLQLSPNAALEVEGNLTQLVRLSAGAKLSLTFPVKGLTPGAGEVAIRLSNDGDVDVEQAVSVNVRSGSLPITTRRPIEIAAGGSLTVDGNLLADSILPGSAVSIHVSRAPAFDIPALLSMLDRYPYGCAEQTTSRALPLLYLSEMAGDAGEEDDPKVKERIQDAIYRVLSYQSSSGSFGLWGPGYGDLWLDSYVTDFLTRAREQGYTVPEDAMAQALTNIQNAVGYDNNVQERGNEMAYGYYVLARNRRAAIADLRYYADTKINDFPTPLAKAHIAAALSLYGDQNRAASIFDAALRMAKMTTDANLARSDYGSAVRDDAAVLTLAAESRPQATIIPDMASLTARQWEAQTWVSTQEQSWMLLAARAVKDSDKDLALEVNGKATQGGYSARMTGDDLMESPVTIANKSGDKVTAMVTTIAAPATPLPAGGDGFTIERYTYTMDGEEVSLSEARQNERYVIVLQATPTNDWSARVLLTDMLPAGFAIDNPSLVSSAQLTNFDWLGEVTAAHTEFRSDRFVAAFDKPAGDVNPITVAYVVRAVTPGKYDYPAAVVEDMYRPQFQARTATGMLEVTKAD